MHHLKFPMPTAWGLTSTLHGIRNFKWCNLDDSKFARFFRNKISSNPGLVFLPVSAEKYSSSVTVIFQNFERADLKNQDFLSFLLKPALFMYLSPSSRKLLNRNLTKLCQKTTRINLKWEKLIWSFWLKGQGLTNSIFEHDPNWTYVRTYRKFDS